MARPIVKHRRMLHPKSAGLAITLEFDRIRCADLLTTPLMSAYCVAAYNVDQPPMLQPNNRMLSGRKPSLLMANCMTASIAF